MAVITRTGEEIKNEKGEFREEFDSGKTANNTSKMLEVLLDIRELLKSIDGELYNSNK